MSVAARRIEEAGKPRPQYSGRGPKRANDVDVHIGRRLKVARRELKLSQTKAADALDLTFQQIQKYENGSNRISCGNLAILADLYGKPVAWFFDGVVVTAGQITIKSDIAAELLAAPHGADLARHYIAMENSVERRLLVDMAATLARPRR